MRLCTVSTEGLDPFFGLLVKDKIMRVARVAEAYRLRPAQRATLSSMMSYLEGTPHSEALLRKLLQRIAEDPAPLGETPEDGVPCLVPVRSVTFHPPVPKPGKVLCIGLNYKDHCEEQDKPLPEFPIVFNKFATSLIGHEADIPLPTKLDDQIDYEAELAFVVGKSARRVKKRTAMNHVAGFMAMNDISLRSLQGRERQWSRAKGFDGSGPCGPFLVTTDELGDPHNLAIKCRVNGKVMQTSNTKHLVFKVPELIQHITAAMTLEPGDIVSTGTPGGVGLYRVPPVFLKPGDTVEVEIEKIGTLKNKCVDGK